MAHVNPFDFMGKTALAGATGGLGRPIALAFAEAGANIAAGARGEAALAALAEEIREATGEVLTAAVDLCVEDEVTGFVDRVCQRLGRIDVLVTLVGGILRKPLSTRSPSGSRSWTSISRRAGSSARRSAGRWSRREAGGSSISPPAPVPRHPGLSGLQFRQGGSCRAHPRARRVMGTARRDDQLPVARFRRDVVPPGCPERSRAGRADHDRMPLGELMPDDALVGPTLFLTSNAARWINGYTINVDTGFNAT